MTSDVNLQISKYKSALHAATVWVKSKTKKLAIELEANSANLAICVLHFVFKVLNKCEIIVGTHYYQSKINSWNCDLVKPFSFNKLPNSFKFLREELITNLSDKFRHNILSSWIIFQLHAKITFLELMCWTYWAG